MVCIERERSFGLSPHELWPKIFTTPKVVTPSAFRCVPRRATLPNLAALNRTSASSSRAFFGFHTIRPIAPTFAAVFAMPDNHLEKVARRRPAKFDLNRKVFPDHDICSIARAVARETPPAESRSDSPLKLFPTSVGHGSVFFCGLPFLLPSLSNSQTAAPFVFFATCSTALSS